jgi:hypothetical protein
MNIIGKSVVHSGNKRAAEVALGDPFDTLFLDLKDYAINPER